MHFQNTKKDFFILLLLISSIVALLFAPTLMPESYSWIAHTTSESGAQGIEGAWLARVGFTLYGLAVILLTGVNRKRWSKLAIVAHLLFGICMIGTAVFSSKPWDPLFPFSEFEDILHSWMSGIVGTAFTFGVLVIFFQRPASDVLLKSLDVFAFIVAVGVTALMFNPTGIEGLLQRFMFLVSYLWYAKEICLLRIIHGIKE